jgi:hypothetical protein
MKFSVLSSLVANALSVSAGTVLWDGRFNDMTSATDLNNWSWGNQVGPYRMSTRSVSQSFKLVTDTAQSTTSTARPQ